MVKHNRRKNFVAIPFDVAITLGTLANETVVKQTIFASALTRGLFCISADIGWSLDDFTANEGPVFVGVAHDDLTVLEIFEALNAELSDPSDIIQRERARRPVRRSGYFPGLNVREVINDGAPLRTTMKFSVHDESNLALYALNKSGAAFTTGAFVKATGVLFARWF